MIQKPFTKKNNMYPSTTYIRQNLKIPHVTSSKPKLYQTIAVNQQHCFGLHATLTRRKQIPPQWKFQCPSSCFFFYVCLQQCLLRQIIVFDMITSKMVESGASAFIIRMHRNSSGDSISGSLSLVLDFSCQDLDRRVY